MVARQAFSFWSIEMSSKFKSGAVFSMFLVVVTVGAVAVTHWFEDSIDGEETVKAIMNDSVTPPNPNPLLKLKEQGQAAKTASDTDAAARIIYSIGQLQTQRETDGRPDLLDLPVNDLESAAAWMQALAKETLEAATPQHNTLEQLRNARPQ